MDEILNVDVRIEGIQDTGSQVKIKGSDGKTYSFFKDKQTGGSTVAFTQFGDMGLKVGDTVNVGYKVKSFTMQNGREGTVNNVTSFRETNQKPVVKTPVAQQIAPGASRMGQVEPKTDWDKIGRVKALCGMVNGMLSSGKEVGDVLLQINRLGQVLARIEDVAGKPLPRNVPDPITRASDPEDVNQAISEAQAEELSVKDVPF